jgi:hypothetical protein
MKNGFPDFQATCVESQQRFFAFTLTLTPANALHSSFFILHSCQMPWCVSARTGNE